MICLRCGRESAISSASCPSCGAPMPATNLTGDTATPAVSARPPAQAQAFRLDPARWAFGDRVCGAATVVLFISLFLPWYSASASFAGISASSSVDALTAHGYLYLVLVLALLMVGYLVAYAGVREMPALPLSHERLLAVVAGINLVLVFIAVIFKPSGDGVVNVGWSFGAFIGLIAAIAALAPMARSWIQARR